MINAQQKCPVCQKSKTKTSGGFVTQFLDRCHCDAKGSVDKSAAITLCNRCGKVDRLARNDGSLTQWIFKSSRCDCPEPAIHAKESPAEREEELEQSREKEIELELSPVKFPTERYKPLAVLGNGASGTVYLARDRLLRKKVAVKVLHDVSGRQLISFQKEARITSRLKHPNIIGIIDFGPTSGGAPYMVLDYAADAITLRERIARGESTLESSIELFLQLCDALEYAHNMGIYHRDLKPSNILVASTADGEIAKIIDFGVANVTESAQETTVYQGQTIVGTPAYMAPELLQQRKFDARSEVYSLGCVLFETISEHPPFEGSSALEILGMHAHSEVPELPLEDSNKYKQNLQSVISLCLAKDRANRCPSMNYINCRR